MPWVLKNKKKLLACVVAIISIGIIFTSFWYVSIIGFLFIIFYLLEHLLKGYNAKALAVMHQRHNIVKIKTLVIGDVCDESIYKKYQSGETLKIQAPDRSLEASYQIFMHIESVLEENGNLIIVNDSKVDQQRYSVFDIQFLNSITRKELGIEKLANEFRHPLIYSPIISMKILFRLQKRGYKVKECPNKNLADFCCERRFNIIYLSR